MLPGGTTANVPILDCQSHGCVIGGQLVDAPMVDVDVLLHGVIHGYRTVASMILATSSTIAQNWIFEEGKSDGRPSRTIQSLSMIEVIAGAFEDYCNKKKTKELSMRFYSTPFYLFLYFRDE